MKHFLLKNNVRQCLFLIVYLFQSSVWAAGLWGQLETLAQADNHYNEDEAFVEQWGELRYQADGFNSGLAFALRAGIEGLEAQLHQGYLRQTWAPYTVTVGRFERADLTGFYYLDGVTLQRQTSAFNVSMYAGDNRRIEYFESESSDSLIGMDTQFFLPLKTTLKLGMQHYEVVNRFNFGLKNFMLTTEGSWADKKIDHFLINTHSDVGSQGHIGAIYETYNPLEPLISFRERFYRLYARGRQSGLSGYGFYKTAKDRQWKLEGRKLWRDFGKSGYAISVTAQSNTWESRLDWLNVGDERAINWFVSAEKPLTARWLGTFSGVMQQKQTELLDKNWAMGVAMQFKYMLKSDLFVSFSAEHIWQTEMDDEYQVGIRLHKGFYGKGKSKF